MKRLMCKLFGHTFKRARKGQDAGLKYCARCAATKEVKRRAPKEPAQ